MQTYEIWTINIKAQKTKSKPCRGRAQQDKMVHDAGMFNFEITSCTTSVVEKCEVQKDKNVHMKVKLKVSALDGGTAGSPSVTDLSFFLINSHQQPVAVTAVALSDASPQLLDRFQES